MSGVAVALGKAHDEMFRGLSATVGTAAAAALATAQANTPRRTGRAVASWSRERNGTLEHTVISSDHPAKMRWLEGRYRILARGRVAADRVVSSAYPGYDPPPVSLSPLW